jgi:hypothetical protein
MFGGGPLSRIIQRKLFMKKLSSEDLYKIGKSVGGLKAIAPINGEEKVGAVVYKRKAEYRGLPWQAED